MVLCIDFNYVDFITDCVSPGQSDLCIWRVQVLGLPEEQYRDGGRISDCVHTYNTNDLAALYLKKNRQGLAVRAGS